MRSVTKNIMILVIIDWAYFRLFSAKMLKKTFDDKSSTPTEKAITNLCKAVAPKFIHMPKFDCSMAKASPSTVLKE